MLLQLFLLVYLLFINNKIGSYLYVGMDIISALIVLYLINKSYEPTQKLSWLVVVLVLPIVGPMLYLLFSSNSISKRYNRIYVIDEANEKDEQEYQRIIGDLESKDVNVASQFKYIHDKAGLPVKDGTKSEYLPTGELYFDKLLQELKKAKKYIFMQYFIVEEGKMWNSILTILRKKVEEGVDVRLIYDDIGCIKTLPYSYDRKLRKLGIKCYKFNKFIPVVSANHNNRDHRKLTIVDGQVGFMGGINLADEYINEVEKYGRWKDTGVMLEGKAVDNLLAIFMPTYNVVAKKQDDIEDYKCSEWVDSEGYVQVYGTGPIPAYNENVASDVYLNLIYSATKYLYITTPYLITDYNMMHALELAAKRGVDVRIVTPHVPDKKLVFMLTQQSYEQLLKSGVKIYEYTPGFIHAKQMICDDDKAIIGTINLDYRSLVHNFECATYLYKDPTILTMKDEYNDLLEDCDEIDLKKCKVKWYVSLLRKTLSFFSPVL